eukprot:COSAG02_NODE_8474_length_2560_cov_3.102397_2_plen_39_part_00
MLASVVGAGAAVKIPPHLHALTGTVLLIAAHVELHWTR